jgi:hypothetical protein
MRLLPHVLVFTANDRPAYMRQVLGSWAACPGIADVPMIFLCEPGCPAMVETCAAAGAFCKNVEVRVNTRREGALGNPYRAFEAGFTRAEFVIVAEDDTTVTPGALAFFAAADRMFRHQPRVAAVSPFRHHSPAAPRPGAIELTTAFESTIWATWRDRWDNLIRGTWDHDYSRKGFDWNLQRIIDEQELQVAQPQLSRAQHIGEHGGTHMQPGLHARLQSDCVAADDPPPDWFFAGNRAGRPARESV